MTDSAIAEVKPQTRSAVVQMFEHPSFQSTLQKTAASWLDPARLIEVVTSLYMADDNLRKATPSSVLAAVLKAARYGVLPVGTKEGGYLVARWNKNANAHVAQFQSSYIGEMMFIRRAMPVRSIVVETIRENDDFQYRPADEMLPIHHGIDGKKPRGALTGAYAMVRGKSGEIYTRVLDMDDIQRAKNRSEGLFFRNGDPNPNSPWNTDEVEMILKTAIRRVAKLCPVSSPWDEDEQDEESVERVPASQGPSTSGESVDPPVIPQEAGTVDDAVKPAPEQAPMTVRELVAQVTSIGFDEQALRDEAQLNFGANTKLEELTPGQLAQLAKMFGRATKGSGS